MRVFEGLNANEVWEAAAVALLDESQATQQDSQHGMTSEIIPGAFVIQDPRQRWVSCRRPPMNPAFALAEVVWILNGRNDSKLLNFWNRRLPKYSGTGPTYHGAYGQRLRKHLGFDQLERVWRIFGADPANRQVVLQIWDSGTDLPDENGMSVARDVPCNVMAILKVRDGRLFWTQIIRSNDLFLGVPFNFVQFTTLQEVLAGWLGLELGPYSQWSDSLHLYMDQVDDVRTTAFGDSDALPASHDRFDDSKEASESAWGILSNYMDRIVSGQSSSAMLLKEMQSLDVGTTYRNIAAVLLADALRRRDDNDGTRQAIESCSNPAYRELFQRWLERQKATTKRDMDD